MKSTSAFVVAFAVLALAVDAQADCGKCCAKGASAEQSAAVGCCGQQSAAVGCCGQQSAAVGCCGQKCTSATCSVAQCDASKGCPIAAAMERLPKLTYAVGKKKTDCPKEAAKLAKESGGHVRFCVADREFDSESDAQMALIDATEKFVGAFTKPHTCPKSGQLTLAGLVQSCPTTAAHTADLMQRAMAKVTFSYLVGDKECGCPVEAARLAKESGKQKLFVVGGQKTACEKTARLNLARAKYKAAIEAMVQAQAAAAKPESAAGT